MRYVLATIFVCTVGMPAASALPTVSPNSVSVSKADPLVQVVRRNRPHSHRDSRSGDGIRHRHSRSGTASTLWSEAVTTKSEGGAGHRPGGADLICSDGGSGSG
jgi:hypothetical protein